MDCTGRTGILSGQLVRVFSDFGCLLLYYWFLFPGKISEINGVNFSEAVPAKSLLQFSLGLCSVLEVSGASK